MSWDDTNYCGVGSVANGELPFTASKMIKDGLFQEVIHVSSWGSKLTC